MYMGRQLSKEGMRPTGEHLKAIGDAPAPQDVGALRSRLGMVNIQSPFVDADTSFECFAVDEESVRLVAGSRNVRRRFRQSRRL